MNPSATKKTPFERQRGQELNTIKRIITNHKQIISDNQEVNINNNDFESGQDSAIMVKESARETKLEGLYKKRKGVLLENSNHTITLLPAGRTQSTIISKRDNGQNGNENKLCCFKWNNTQINQQLRISEQKNKVAMENETPTPQFDALESEVIGQSDSTYDVNPESEHELQQPIITPNYTIGMGKPKRTAHQTMIELKKRAQRQKQQQKLRKQKQKEILKKFDTIFSDSEEELDLTNNPERENHPNNDQQEEKHKEETNNNETKENTSRRGERTRNKPDFYGHNIVVTQLSSSPTQEEEH